MHARVCLCVYTYAWLILSSESPETGKLKYQYRIKIEVADHSGKIMLLLGDKDAVSCFQKCSCADVVSLLSTSCFELSLPAKVFPV